MSKRFAFDINKALPAAWATQWKAATQRAIRGKQPDGQGYVTATDMENQVRRFAEETSKGLTWGEMGPAWGAGFTAVRLSGLGAGGVLGRCRDWLLDEVRAGRLEAHNFGRGHISGMRFRAKGAEISDAELKTIARRAERKPKPRHYARKRQFGLSGVLLCREHLPRTTFSRTSHRIIRISDVSKVTCPRCLKLIAQEGIK